jgi:hypothetical protein
MSRQHTLIAIGLLIVLAALAFIMNNQIPPRIDLPYDLQSTTLAIEFASRPDDIAQVLGYDRRYVPDIVHQQYWDFVFIPCYVALFVVLGLGLRAYPGAGARRLSIVAIALAVIAGVFDICENITILRVAHVATPLSSRVRWFSMPKWGLVVAVMLLESALFFFWPKLAGWWRAAAIAVGALFAFAGAAGLLFTLLASFSDIEWSTAWMTGALVALLAFLIAIEIRRRLRGVGLAHARR